MSRITDFREDYTYGGLLESEAHTDAMEQFSRWFADAQTAGLAEVNAMALATATPGGVPSVRMVLLKGIDRGFVFFTNYESRKARELDANPYAALCIYWKELERQIRASGTVERITQPENAEYFQSRPRGSQLGAWASPQSSEVASRSALEAAYEKFAREFEDKQVPVPDSWGGYRLVPESIEFWQGRTSRLHDRLLYERSADGWTRKRLAP